jgi:hypothetical protein
MVGSITPKSIGVVLAVCMSLLLWGFAFHFI